MRFESTQKGQSLADRQGLAVLASGTPGKALKAHNDLTKAESSLLVQARTGKIGLRQFLFQRRVPGVATPLCECGGAEETVAYALEGCFEFPEGLDLQRKEGPVSTLLTRLQEGIGVRPILRWLMGRLPEYRLAAAGL